MKQRNKNILNCVLFNGLGGAGQRHLRIINQLLPGVKKIGSRSKDKTPYLNPDFSINQSHNLQDAYGISFFKSIEAAYLENPDLAIISTPTSLHCENIIQAAERGVDVIVEKPGATNSKQAKKIVDAVKANNIQFFISYQRRFHPLVQKLRQLINKKTLGKIMSVQVCVGSYVPDWHPYEDFRDLYACNKNLGGGVLKTETHELDLLTWLFGNPNAVNATGGCRGPFELDVEDSAELLLDYQTFSAQVNLCFMQKKQERNISIIGQEGSLKLDLIEEKLEIFLHSSNKEEIVSISMDNETLFRTQAEFFLSGLESGDFNYCDTLLANSKLVDNVLNKLGHE